MSRAGVVGVDRATVDATAHPETLLGVFIDHPRSPACMTEITITTTDSIDGREVVEYCGLVSGEAVIGANIVSDIAGGIRDIVGGRSGSYEKKIETGRQEALADLRAEAEGVGADAVVGAAFDYEEMAEGMLWVNVAGTAVQTRRA